jgi:hypothetical protein
MEPFFKDCPASSLQAVFVSCTATTDLVSTRRIRPRRVFLFIGALMRCGHLLPTNKSREMPEDKIRIRCTKCTAVFRERGTRIRNGFQLNCPQCNRSITFDTSSDDLNVRKAFQAARFLRQALEAEASNTRQVEMRRS